MSRLPFSVVAIVSCLLLSMEPAAGQIGDLVKPVPPSANALMLFDAVKVFESPAATSGGWRESYEKAFAAGLVAMPPETNRFVAASLLDFEFMEPIWDVAVLELDHQAAMPSIARKLGGTLDTVADLPAVVLPSDIYLVQLAENVVAARAPANRQVVGRWLREMQGRGQTSLTPYLQKAIGYVDNVGTPIIIALDLQDVFVPQDVTERLGTLECMQDRNVDIQALTSVLCSIRGVTLGISIKEKPFGSIMVEFDQDVSIMADFAKPMLLEILSKRSAMIEDFETWSSQATGNKVTLMGYLSEDGLRRVMSLMEAPIQFAQASAGGEAAEDTGEPKQEDIAQASKTYFDSIQTLFGDLRGRKGTASHLNVYGVWFDKYARKVDQLPLLNVDPDLLDYGQFVAEQFRNASMAVKGIGMRSRVRQVNAVANMEPPVHSVGGYRYGRYGSYGGGGWRQGYVGNPLQGSLRQQQSIRTQVKTQEKVSGAANVQGIMQGLQQASSDIRRAMTAKYQIEF